MDELLEVARGESGAADNVNIVASVHTRLRKMILDGTLAPGTVLSQAELAKSLGVSRTPLREALRMLQHEGLIEAEQNRRPRVATIEPEAVDAIYAERIMLEVLGVTLTVPLLGPADLDSLRAAFDGMAAAAQRQDIDEWEVPHRRFHQLLVMHAGTHLYTKIAGCAERSERYRRLYAERVPRAGSVCLPEHDAIVDACVQRQPELAAQRLARHLARTALTLLVQIAPEYEPRAVRAALRITGADNARVDPVAELRRG